MAANTPLYAPNQITFDTTDPTQVAQWAQNEFQVLSRALTNITQIQTTARSTAPLQPRTGLVAYADGVNWNPTSGEGLYEYTSAGVWIPLGSSTRSLTPGNGMVNGVLVATAAANALTVAVKTLAGNDPSPGDPVLFIFPKNTFTNAAFDVIPVTAPLSLTIPQGATFGQSATNVVQKVWVHAINNAGTVQLAFIQTVNWGNWYSWVFFPDVVMISCNAISAASTSSITFYSNATVSNVATQQIGFFETSFPTTLGNWVAPTLLRTCGSAMLKRGTNIIMVSQNDNTTVNVSATANTPTLAGPSISFNPRFASDLVRIIAQTDLFNGNTANNIVSYGIMFNGVTSIGRTPFIYGGTAFSFLVPATALMWHSPQTTGVVSYQAYGQQSVASGGGQVGNASVNPQNWLSVEEFVS